MKFLIINFKINIKKFLQYFKETQLLITNASLVGFIGVTKTIKFTN